MTQPTYSLPPRKWYTLEQAAKRIAKLTGEEIEVADLLHYASIGLFEMSVYIEFNAEKRLDIQGLNLLPIFEKLKYISFRATPGNYNKSFYKTETAEAKIFEDHEIFDIRISNNRFFLKTNLEYAKGFFVIDFADYKNNSFIDDANPLISTNDILFRFSRNEMGRYSFGLVIESFDKNLNKAIYLNKDCFYILTDELETLLQGGKQINDVSFDDMIREYNLSKRNIENPIAEKNKGGRPRSPHTEKIIVLGQDIFEKNPDVNLESIANSILDYFNDQNIVLSIQLVRRVLKENNIGLKGGKSRKIKSLP